jgi:hypothetical protein
VQDLVRVGIADAAEQPWIGKRALQRVALAPQPLGESAQVAGLHVDAAGIQCGQRCAPVDQMQRGTAPAAGFGEHQAAGDHQVDHQEELALQAQHHALAQALDAHHLPALGAGDRRQRGAQHEGVEQLHTPQHLADATLRQAFDIDGDVGQLGHVASVPPDNDGLRTAATR